MAPMSGACLWAAPWGFLPALVLQLHTALADVDNVFPVLYVSNPVARHVACAVPAGVPTVCTLDGHEASNLTLHFLITALPASGKLYETSQNFRTYGTDPKYGPVPIQEYELPFRVSDPFSRVVYVPPSDVFPPEGRWGAATYTVQEPVSGDMSQPGQVAMSSPAQYVAASTFISGTDSWIISGNIHSTTPTWQAFGWGLLNRYIYAADEVQYMDFDTFSDRSKWYFEAPPGKFYLPELAATYGGKIKFTIASTYGDFTHLNSPLDFIVLDCASCNSGRGIRIVRYADNGLEWDGSERVIEVTVATGQHWRRDPLSLALPFTDATECEIAAVLAGLTRFRILGDHTRAGEGVAIDDVSISSSPVQPAYPLPCQQGCVCAHDPRDRRLSCCGSDPNIYHPLA
eukprot:CAMPEP_0197899002 /NCGR_PEP_ID=MMETSP1439-20131203/45379_1 /TAXON_ID=66791 /ORGANISM="Gonyaulax spinifera, Strain CCMP409" /LENGTH=400 /DNA_ID=CAMNT_0043519767 /DNA_START=64 /DNA_END=1266 /DNA_ORIENTATION=+